LLEVLSQRTFARLFAAQIVALLGTGLLTIALGLLAYDLAGERAGIVLGTALAIKMVAYVTLAPVASALIGGFSRKKVLIAMDLIRAAIALALPFIDTIAAIYLAIFCLQAASATFTPTFQALIPDILSDERDYTNALSLSRLAYDLENLISPALAGLLLLAIGFHWLFVGTVLGFLLSAFLIKRVTFPIRRSMTKERRFSDRLTRGARIYLATPRLRALLWLNLAAAATGAMVIVNTIVIVRDGYLGSESDVAIAMAVFGLGSMLGAFSLPLLLDRQGDRPVMISAAFTMAALLLAIGASAVFDAQSLPWTGLLAIWFAVGLGFVVMQTPSGRLLKRSTHQDDRASVFAAQFAFSHACWLLTYPLAGWAGHALGMSWTMIILGATTLFGGSIATAVWPKNDPDEVDHLHDNLPPDHPHLKGATHKDGVWRHRHLFIIDDNHQAWP